MINYARCSPVIKSAIAMTKAGCDWKKTFSLANWAYI
jgi:hypothetical protein